MQVRVSLEAAGLCASVGVFRGVMYVFCGLARGHAGKCEYAPNPAGKKAIDTEPLDAVHIEPVETGSAHLPPLLEMLRKTAAEQRGGLRVPAG